MPDGTTINPAIGIIEDSEAVSGRTGQLLRIKSALGPTDSDYGDSALKFTARQTGAFAKQAVKTGPGVLCGLIFTNSAATAYVGVFDATAANVTPGTTVPDLLFVVAANSTFVFTPLEDIQFSNAITVFSSTAELGGTGTAATTNLTVLYA